MAQRKSRAKKDPYGNTGEWQPGFLAALRKVPNVLKAAQAAGISRRAAYKEKDNNPEFAAEWADAIQEGIENIEGIAMELATDPNPKHNSLRMFFMRFLKSEVYGDKSELLLKGSKDQPLHMKHSVDLSRLSNEELDLLERILSGGSSETGPGEAAGPGGGQG